MCAGLSPRLLGRFLLGVLTTDYGGKRMKYPGRKNNKTQVYVHEHVSLL